MKNNLISAIRLTLVSLVFFCGIYTLSVLAVAQLAPGEGKGFTISENGQEHHVNIGQGFSSNNYFWSRPSAVNYDAAGSGGSNYGPSNPDHLAEVEERIKYILEQNPEIEKYEIPSDLVTSSGSGLDPHISVQAAKIQIKRIAQIRNLEEKEVIELIDRHIEKPLLGLFGTERINVLKLNISLDQLATKDQI
ncbi:K(+)-transporting ATPase subunit C [Peijinzhouia sedimentorum]